jgi:hypothetical protein
VKKLTDSAYEAYLERREEAKIKALSARQAGKRMKNTTYYTHKNNSNSGRSSSNINNNRSGTSRWILQSVGNEIDLHSDDDDEEAQETGSGAGVGAGTVSTLAAPSAPVGGTIAIEGTGDEEKKSSFWQRRLGWLMFTRKRSGYKKGFKKVFYDDVAYYGCRDILFPHGVIYNLWCFGKCQLIPGLAVRCKITAGALIVL